MKPIIFFSHSSRDRDALLPIRNRLLEGTGNAVEVFMSSDGASIPFGRNWLKQVEDALSNCKLMFVWMTPASLASNWILFESGYAYSKGIRVVPIGFQGIKLENLPAPISILQGFNVTNAGGLNNIIAVINEEFRLTFPELYNDTFYQTNVKDITSEDSPELLRFVISVQCEFWPSLHLDDNATVNIHSDWFEILKRFFKETNTSFSEQGNELHGIGFRVEVKKERIRTWPLVNIDPLALNSTWKLWEMAHDKLYDGDTTNTVFVTHLVPGLELPDDQSMIGARLLRSDVSFDTKFPHILYGFRNIDFRIRIEKQLREWTKELVLLVPKGNKDPIPLLSLLRLLEERRIIRTR